MIATQPPTPRQCGRCRLSFPGDPALDAATGPKWWLCEPCRLAFFGVHRRLTLVDGPDSTP